MLLLDFFLEELYKNPLVLLMDSCYNLDNRRNDYLLIDFVVGEKTAQKCVVFFYL